MKLDGLWATAVCRLLRVFLNGHEIEGVVHGGEKADYSMAREWAPGLVRQEDFKLAA